MRFDRLHETLEGIERQDVVTIEDALDLFYDFYEDVKTASGSVLEQHPAGDRDQVVGRLCWLARMTARLYSRNESELLAPEYEARWEKAAAKLSEAQAGLSEAAEEAARWQEQAEKLDGLLTEAAGQRSQAEEARRLCREKEASLARIRELAGETAQLEEEAEALKRQEAEAAAKKARLLERTARLRQCVAAWRGDEVLQADWPCDGKWLDSLREELERAEKTTEDALAAYLERYRELAACLEGGGKEQ